MFAFASYNAGPAKIAKMRTEAAARGLDPDKWFNNVEIVVAEKIGIETTTYVRNIYKYYAAYRLIVDSQDARDKAIRKMQPGELTVARAEPTPRCTTDVAGESRFMAVEPFPLLSSAKFIFTPDAGVATDEPGYANCRERRRSLVIDRLWLRLASQRVSDTRERRESPGRHCQASAE